MTPTDAKSETPRTDAAAYAINAKIAREITMPEDEGLEIVPAELARSLERKLKASRALTSEVLARNGKIKAELAAAHALLERMSTFITANKNEVTPTGYDYTARQLLTDYAALKGEGK